jgi:hypothetical protein
MHVEGYSAPETKAAVERARLLIEQAEALGEPLEDPQLLFSVLIGVWSANFVAFNGDVSRDLAAQILALAEKQKASFHHRRDQQGSAMVGHNFLGAALLVRGEIAEARTHFDQAAEKRRERGRRMADYDTTEHRPLATRFREDPGVSILFFRSKTLWLLGYPGRLRSRTSTKRSSMRARAATQFPCYGHSVAQSFSSIATAEITRRQMSE